MIEKLLQIMNNISAGVTIYTKYFAEFTQANPVVGGIIGMWVLGLATWLLKSVPMRIYGFLLKQFTVTVTIHNSDRVFHNMDKVFQLIGLSDSSRTLRAYNRHGDWGSLIISSGYGVHYFVHNYRPYKLVRAKEESGQSLHKDIKETLTITTIGRSQESLRDLIEISNQFEVQKVDTKHIYTYNSDGWTAVGEVVPRKFNTVIISKSNEERLIKHLDNFYKSKEFYDSKGISYRTGILLEGPPGTGKTSLAKALATKYEKDLYVISLSTMSDNLLNKAMSKVGDNAIVLIEDFDTSSATRKRVEGEDGVAVYETLTLSGILNSIDGVYSSQGRVLLMTTNHVNSVDPALIRPGRCDLRLHLGVADEYMINKMYKRFYNGDMPNVVIETQFTPAELENIAIFNLENPEGFVNDLVSGQKYELTSNNVQQTEEMEVSA